MFSEMEMVYVTLKALFQRSGGEGVHLLELHHGGLPTQLHGGWVGQAMHINDCI